MKITMYELLGLVKDGKAPEYIKYCGAVYSSLYFENRDSMDYEDVKSGDLLFADRVIINEHLNDEVEIIEKEKKIPEKITINENGTLGFPNGEWTARNMDKAFAIKFNEIIDCLDYLNNKGDE